MNRDLSDLPGAGDQRDPVADFFAAERRAVRDLPSGREHWDGILREANRPRRRSALPYAAAVAAVAVVGAVAWGTLGGRPDGTDAASTTTSGTTSRPQTTVTSTVTVTATPGPPLGVTSGPATSPPTSGPLPVARSFGIVSLSNAGGGHLFALGSADCPGSGPCTQVAASDDDGATWQARATFERMTAPGPRSVPTAPNQLVGLRFATPQVGYAYGSTLKRTTDGGRHWSDVPLDGASVLSLETDGSTVWMVTGRCSADRAAGGAHVTGGCTQLGVRRGSVDSTSTAPLGISLGDDDTAAWITLDGSQAYVNQSSSKGFGDNPAAIRVSGSAGQAVAVPAGCADGPWVTAAAAAPGTLVGLCPDGTDAGRYRLATSTDAGATWTSRTAPGLGKPTAPGAWLTAVDATHLVALQQGAPSHRATKPTRLLTSADGGATWNDAGLGAGDRTAWAGAAGGSLVYAFEGGLTYWRSTDAGAGFGAVPLRRQP